MNPCGGCSSLQLSVQLSAAVEGVPVNLTASVELWSNQGELSNQVTQLPVGATPFPLGSVPAGSVAFLYLQNLDQTNPIYVSTNANGSAPFAEVLAGEPLVLPAVPGTSYYLRVDSVPIEAVCLALSS